MNAGNSAINGTFDVTGTTNVNTIGTASTFIGNAIGGTTINGPITAGSTTISALNVTGNTTTGTLNAGATTLGATTATTLGTSGLATLNAATVNTTLNVDGAATFNGDVNLVGADTDLTIGDDLIVGGTATVAALTTLNGGTNTTTLGTSGLATLNSASVTNDASVGGDLTVTGDINTTGDITTPAGNVLALLGSFTDVFTSQDVSVGGDLTVLDDAVISGDITTTDITAEDITAETVTINGDAGLGLDLNVTGTSRFDGNVTLANTSDLAVGGDATVTGTAIVTGATTLNGGATVNGGILDANAGADVTGTTNISGATTINAGLEGTSTTIGNPASATTVGGTLGVTGATTLATTNVNGVATFGNNIVQTVGTTSLTPAVGTAGSILTVENAGAGLAGVFENNNNSTPANATINAINIGSTTTGGYAIYGEGHAQVTGRVEGISGADVIYQIGNDITHSGANIGGFAITEGLVFGAETATLTRTRMVYDGGAGKGQLVVGPATATISTDFFTVDPNGDNVTINSSGAASGSNAFDIIHSTSNAGSSALSVVNSPAASGTSVPLAVISRDANSGAALQVLFGGDDGAGAGVGTAYALEVRSDGDNGGAILAEAKELTAVAGDFGHDDSDGTALRVSTGSLLIQSQGTSPNGGARFAGDIFPTAQNTDITGNSMIYHYTGAAGTLAPGTPVTNGIIIYVICDNAQNPSGGATDDIKAGNVGIFVSRNGAWQLVGADL